MRRSTRAPTGKRADAADALHQPVRSRSRSTQEHASSARPQHTHIPLPTHNIAIAHTPEGQRSRTGAIGLSVTPTDSCGGLRAHRSPAPAQ